MSPQWILVARHGDERVAIDLALVREISRMLLPRHLPGEMSAMLGVIDLRGELIPALDLERRLPTGGGGATLDHHMIIVEAGLTLAIVVSHVEDIEPVPEGAFRSVPRELSSGIPLTGVARSRAGLVPVLDPTRLLADHEIVAFRDAAGRIGMEQ